MDRRGFLKGAGQVTVAGAVGSALRPARALIGMLGGAPAAAVPASNPIGLNFDSGGGAFFSSLGLPIHNNRFREASVSAVTGALTFDSNGWPIGDQNVKLFDGANQPSWMNGVWKCGFTTVTGTETIAAYSGGSIVSGSIVRGAVGQYTTFDLNSGSGVFGYSITNTGGNAITNQYAYYPGYAGTLAIDDPTQTSSLHPKIIDHYSRYAELRAMWPLFTPYVTQLCTSANINTASNVQTAQAWNGPGGVGNVIAPGTTAPLTGAKSFDLGQPWYAPPGTYQLIWYTTSATYATRVCTCTNGSATVSFTTGLLSTEIPVSSTSFTGSISGTTLTVSSGTVTNNQVIAGTGVAPETIVSGTGPYSVSISQNVSSESMVCGPGIVYGVQGYPVHWMIPIAQATGCVLRINTPWLEDGTNYSAGSYTTALMNAVKAAGIKTKWELSNENWNPAYRGLGLWNELTALTGFADKYHYLAYRLNALATVGRTVFGSDWGVKHKQVYADQTNVTDGNNWGVGWAFYNVLSVYSTYGTITSDVHEIDCAPYCNPTVGNSDSIATIQSEANTAAKTAALGHGPEGNGVELIAATGMHFGLPTGMYEGNFQWNLSQYSGVTNLGTAIMDTGYETPMETLIQGWLNAGISETICFFQDGVNCSGNALSPEDSLTTYAVDIESSPPALAIKTFQPPNAITITRNVITTPGAIIQGYNYAGNSSDISTTEPTLGNQHCPTKGNYGETWLLYSAVARTVTLSAEFANPNGYDGSNGLAGSTQLEYGNATDGYSILGGISTPTSISIPIGTNVVPIGSFPVKAGWSYIVFGNPTVAQSGITVNSLTCG